MAASRDAAFRNADRGFPQDIRPAGELIATELLADAAAYLRVPIWRWSIWLSIVAAVGFVWAVYLLTWESTDDRGRAGLVAAASVVPVHALGGTTYGFQALGFLPRDYALIGAVLVFWVYIRGVRRESEGFIVGAGLICGLLANLYSVLSAHLAITIGVAELIRRRQLSRGLIGFSALYAVGAAPAIVDVFYKTLSASPVDLAILRMRHGYMLASPFFPALRQYLRRFAVYVIILVALRIAGGPANDRRAHAWWCVALGSAVVAVIGVYLETETGQAKYMLSRTSVFTVLAAMQLLVTELPRAATRYVSRHSIPIGLVVASLVFAIQSNLPTVARYLRDTRSTRGTRLDLLAAADRLRDASTSSDVMLAPSSEFQDWAATIRAYALRPTFVCYKDGGVSLVDGARGREWLKRFESLQSVLSAGSAERLLGLMSERGIAYAVLPVRDVLMEDPAMMGHMIFSNGRFVVIRRSL